MGVPLDKAMTEELDYEQMANKRRKSNDRGNRGNHRPTGPCGSRNDYVAPDGELIAAELKEVNGSLQVVSLRTLWQTRIGAFNDTFDVSPDGSRFVVDTMSTDETHGPLSLVTNWTAELKK